MIAEVLLLVCALCTDTLIAGMAYGTEKIRIPFRLTVLINGICSGCLGAALVCGGWIDGWISENFTKMICFVSLLFIGTLKLFGSCMRSYLKKHINMSKNICFSLSGLKCIISVYADPLSADADKSKVLTWKEGILFALAMSVDGFIAGTLAAFMKIPTVLTMAAAFFVGEIFLYLGIATGRCTARHMKTDLSWLGGAIFIFLAFWKTFH